MNIYAKAEGILYAHFKKKKRVEILKGKLKRVDNRIDRLKLDIMNSNIKLNDVLKAIDYSSEMVVAGDPEIAIERELEKAINGLMRALENALREKRKISYKIRYIEKQIDDIDIILEQLTDEELSIIELKYGEEKNYRQMENQLPMTSSTIHRKKDKIVEFIVKELNI